MENENDTTDADETPRSPVLGSSTFKRKLLKNISSRKKTKLRLSDRFENEILVADGNSDSKLNFSHKSDETQLHEHERLKGDELPMRRCLSSTRDLSTNELSKGVGFKTASGKPLFSKEESSNFASSLMDEFFNPLAVPLREKKHSFLSKGSFKDNSKSETTQNISMFLGFKDQEYRYSSERVKLLHKITHKILSGTSESTINEQCSTKMFEKDILHLQASDNLCRRNSKLTYTGIYDLKNEIHAEIEVPINKRNSLYLDNSCSNVREMISSSERNFEKGDNIKQNTIHRNEYLCNTNIKTERSERKENIIARGNTTVQKNTPEFITGSGKKISISSSSVSKLKYIFQDMSDIQGLDNADQQCHSSIENLDILDSNININQKKAKVNNIEIHVPQFATASRKKIVIASDKLSKINNIFKDISDLPDDFPSNSGIYNNKRIHATLKSQNKLRDFEKTSLDHLNRRNLAPTGSDYSNMHRKSYEKSAQDITSLFSTASGKTIKLPSSSLAGIHNIFKDIPYISDIKIEDIPVCSDKNTNGDEKSTQKITSLFSTASGNTIKLPPSSLSRIDNIFKDIPFIDDVKQRSEGQIDTNDEEYTPLKKSMIDENALRPAKPIMQKTDGKVEGNDSISYITPQRSLPKKRRLGSCQSSNGKMSEVAMKKARSLFGDMNFDDLKLPAHLKFGSPSLAGVTPFTPKKPNQISTPQFSSTPSIAIPKNDSFLNYVPDEIDQGFTIQRPTPVNLKDLEEELKRQRRVLEKEIEFVMKKSEAIRMQIKAENSNIRYKLEPQVKKNKFNLKDVKNLEAQSDRSRPINSSVLQVNPQNAVLLHFNNNWQNVPTVTTEDACTLVPNKQGFIGISEIEPAFSSMEGIDRSLIPKGWIKNHYRWIVWKLASYKRFFPGTLGDCLTVDNVIKQLKHRYIRELYNAERPALRKIYEKDDIPQKKMVLCISNIIKNGDNTELELTDGWYSIRTIIDDPLCYQINNKKVRIGSKLIISGAEVLNCEGCHPLELQEARKVRLRINFNSTRRATWYSKLGYQKDPSPLPIKVSSAVWNGGNIGRITVYIMRTYPVIYREKMDSTMFWRNQNAEYKRIQEYENECLKKYEEDNNANVVRRNVCSLLKMTVIDVFDTLKPLKCTIWDSTDSHYERLKENQAITCFNLTLRCNGELSCSNKSYFQPSKHDTVKYEKFRRKYVELASYEVMLENSVFREFDTIGFIVKMHTEENSQYFWLTDLKNNFLLVKINEGPNHCLLLSKLEEEYLVAVCNLTLNGSNDGYNIATAGFQTIVTQYPQYDFLREKMEEHGKKTGEELQSILRENKRIIEKFENGNKVDHSSESEGNTLNFSKVTSTDAVMSMINIDEIISKHTM